MVTATKASLIPLEDRVIVQKEESDEKTQGGILLPDSAKEKPQIAKVVAVGPGKKDEKGNLNPPDLKIGDRVVYPKYSGTEIKVEGEEYLILKASDILAKFA
ncbi:MAG: co-chaperone GroES [Candidatus Caenarcaniphilales bacterium]|nr:co-chaperone GroES [Candidatus Caenarcaniphilales bacterium]